MIFDKFIDIIKSRYHFIQNLTNGYTNFNKRALLYYKTDPLYRKNLSKNYTHTNHWEILQIVNILNKNGFVVDVIDRNAKEFTPEDKYDLFIGLGAGNSGKHFVKYAKALKKAIIVLFAAGPEPILSNRLVEERYDAFSKRTGIKAPYCRTIDQIHFPDLQEQTDIFYCVGEEGTFSFNSYLGFNKPVYSILPSASPILTYNSNWTKTRKRNSFICFAGNGLICKGVDILIEAFKQIHNAELYICGPKEDAIFEAYQECLNDKSNIHYEGFLRVGGAKYLELCSKCSFVILNSSSEGCATSVTTCMKSGLVPIVNFESGVNIEKFGIMIENNNNLIQATIDAIKFAIQITPDEYNTKIKQTLISAQKYSQENFTLSFEQALIKTIY